MNILGMIHLKTVTGNQNTNVLIVTVCMMVITVNAVDTMYNSIPENSSSRTRNTHSRYQRCSIKHYRFLL